MLGYIVWKQQLPKLTLYLIKGNVCRGIEYNISDYY